MHILQIAPPWYAVPPQGYGGIEWIVALLADGLVDAGHDVTLLASGGSSTKADLEVVYEEPPSQEIGDVALEVIHILEAYRQRGEIDIVHDHSGMIGPAIGAMVDDVAVVHTLHGPWTEKSRAVYRSISERVNLVAISRSQADGAPDDVRLAGVVHNAIALDRYPALTDGKDDFLLYVGRSCREKGPEVAVDVARRLGRPMVMAMKINEQPERDYFHEEVEPRMQDAEVDLRTDVGHDEKVDLMRRAAVVVDPIQWEEPFGLVMAESMACGTPVVAFDRGAAPELIVDGVTGRLVPAGDIGALCAAVEEAERLDPRACREHAEERFGAQRMVSEYLDVYERVLSAPSPGSG